MIKLEKLFQKGGTFDGRGFFGQLFTDGTIKKWHLHIDGYEGGDFVVIEGEIHRCGVEGRIHQDPKPEGSLTTILEIEEAVASLSPDTGKTIIKLITELETQRLKVSFT